MRDRHRWRTPWILVASARLGLGDTPRGTVVRINRLGTQRRTGWGRFAATALLVSTVALATTACGSSRPAASGSNENAQRHATPTSLPTVITRVATPSEVTADAATREAEPTATQSTTSTPIQVSQADFKLAPSGGFFTDLLNSLPDSTNTRQLARLENWSPFWTVLKRTALSDQARMRRSTRPRKAFPTWLTDSLKRGRLTTRCLRRTCPDTLLGSPRSRR